MVLNKQTSDLVSTFHNHYVSWQNGTGCLLKFSYPSWDSCSWFLDASEFQLPRRMPFYLSPFHVPCETNCCTLEAFEKTHSLLYHIFTSTVPPILQGTACTGNTSDFNLEQHNMLACDIIISSYTYSHASTHTSPHHCHTFACSYIYILPPSLSYCPLLWWDPYFFMGVINEHQMFTRYRKLPVYRFNENYFHFRKNLMSRVKNFKNRKFEKT